MKTPTFDRFSEITAKFDSVATSCGHQIKKGDKIGYARTRSQSHTVCADCWWAWLSAVADEYADQYPLCR